MDGQPSYMNGFWPMAGCYFHPWSATGQILPPFMIFAAKQLNPLWTKDEVVLVMESVIKAGLIKNSSTFG